MVREMILEGILAIQSGDNPRIVREKLEAFLSPSQRGSQEEPAEPAQPQAKAA
jgi:chemotaxis protein MotA